MNKLDFNIDMIISIIVLFINSNTLKTSMKTETTQACIGCHPAAQQPNSGCAIGLTCRNVITGPEARQLFCCVI